MHKLAALGGEKFRKEPYPVWPVFDQKEFNAIQELIQSGRWGGAPFPGPKSVEFSNGFLEMQGGNFAVPMINGTVTMEVALRAAGIGWGDEVIVPAYTFQATASAPMAAGAIPVFVDIDPQSYCIDAKKIRQAITPRTKAIIPVHLGANVADMDAIMAIADEFDLVVVEDAAHAHGAQWDGNGAGTIGDFGSFSFQSSKILTTGEGGMLICRDANMAERAASIIDCGRAKDAQKLNFSMGTNYRLPELQAALGIVGLKRFPEQMAQRQASMDYLEESLSVFEGVRLLKRDLRHTRRSFYRYIFAIDPQIFNASHFAVCYALNAEGIPTYAGYPAMHRYDLFQPKLSRLPVPSAFPEYFDFEHMRFPMAEKASQEEAVWVNESIFRDGQRGVDDLVSALQKVKNHPDGLAFIDRRITEKYGNNIPETITLEI